MSHIEKCRNLYYATLKVPQDLREKLGRTKFKQSLGTGDKRRAQELAKPLVALWKAQLRQAQGEPDAVQAEALRWRAHLTALLAAGEADSHEAVASVVVDKAEQIEAKRGTQAAKEFADLAFGYRTPSALHHDAWAASIVHLTDKTQDQYKADVKRLVDHFTTLEAINAEAVRKWVDELATPAGGNASPASIKRMVSCWRSYWSYLQEVGAAPKGVDPFALVKKAPKKGKAGRAAGWVPFPPQDIPKLAAAALEAGDTALADLITLAAYSGARIEELCSLKWSDVRDHSFNVVDSKTEAGIREVPIHRKLRDLLKTLKAEKADDYVLPGLTFNKYGDRSNAIGKRFGRLKDGMGYGPAHVFHSIRKTVVTLLEDAGVSENLAADIVGHEKPRITYGLYSGGASLKTKADGLVKVAYSEKVGR
jgi:integrase